MRCSVPLARLHNCGILFFLTASRSFSSSSNSFCRFFSCGPAAFCAALSEASDEAVFRSRMCAAISIAACLGSWRNDSAVRLQPGFLSPIAFVDVSLRNVCRCTGCPGAAEQTSSVCTHTAGVTRCKGPFIDNQAGINKESPYT